jgi:hypothetical protein
MLFCRAAPKIVSGRSNLVLFSDLGFYAGVSFKGGVFQ